MHETVLKQEAVNALLVDANGCYVDATFGRGGHTRELLARLAADADLMAIDRDATAEAEAATIVDSRFRFRRASFSQLKQLLESEGWYGRVSGILLDLGVSSPQLDVAERGFSFRFDGPLDMRMDTSQGQSAAEWLAEADESDISYVLKTYGEERFARRIARKIIEARDKAPLLTTSQLVAICQQSIPVRDHFKKHPATRTFQAIRIYVNRELDELTELLDAAVAALKIGGRLVVISFHSLEDRIVKQFMRRQSVPPLIPRSVPIAGDAQPMPLKLVGKAVFASDQEVHANPRARSAVMRIAERCN